MSDKRRGDAESSFLMGDYLARQGDVESATGAFRSAIAYDDPEWSPRAAYHLGELLWAVRDPGGAEAALRVATDAGHPEWSPAAEVIQGVICASRQDMGGAMRAYGAAIATRHRTHAARAWFNLGTLHQQRGETGLAVAAIGGRWKQAQLGRQNLAAMRQLIADRRRGQCHDIVEDAKDLSVGRGSQRWTRWVRRDPP